MPPKPKATRRATKKEPSLEIAELVHAKSPISIDYPQAGETIVSSDYSFRISAQDASKVEISLDNSPWQPCREDAGYWWYDWSGYGDGVHQARAQSCGPNGSILAVASRQVTVRKPKS